MKQERKVCNECGEMVCECGAPMTEEKWMQKAVKKPGQLHKDLGISPDEEIPMSLLTKKKVELQKKAKGDKTLSASDSKLLKRIIFAINAKKLHESVVELSGFIMEKSPPGMGKKVEKMKKALIDKGYDEEKAANIAFGTAWNEYKSRKK